MNILQLMINGACAIAAWETVQLIERKIMVRRALKIFFQK